MPRSSKRNKSNENLEKYTKKVGTVQSAPTTTRRTPEYLVYPVSQAWSNDEEEELGWLDRYLRSNSRGPVPVEGKKYDLTLLISMYNYFR